MTKPSPTYNLANTFLDPKLLENATFTRALTPDEIKSNQKIKEWNAIKNIVKDVLLNVMATIATGYFGYICLAIISNPLSSVDDKKWATSILTAVAVGFISYLTGRSHKI